LFTFNGAYLAGAFNNGLNITVTGLFNGSPLYTQTVIVDTTGPTWFNFNYTGIDKVTFNSFGGIPAGFPNGVSGPQFVMDNFTFNVLEPSSIVTLSIGAMAFAVVAASSCKNNSCRNRLAIIAGG
jgi:hypothetical protein